MTAIILRPAVFDDWALLLDWVNQPDSLAWKSRTTDPIDAQAHKTWLKRFLENGESRIFVVLIADEPVGQIRFQADAECVFVIDVYVEANRRGDGVAQQALAQGMAIVAKTRPSALFQAEVMARNTASRHLFQRLGFVETERTANGVIYERTTKAGQT